MITWIVVANARHARIFSQSGPNKALELVKETELDAAATTMPEFDGRSSPRKGQPAWCLVSMFRTVEPLFFFSLDQPDPEIDVPMQPPEKPQAEGGGK